MATIPDTPDTAIPFFSNPAHEPFLFSKNGGSETAGALLIHGFPGTPAEMRPVGQWLVEHGWSARGPRLPGLGSEIARLNQMEIDDWLDAVRATWAEVRHSHRRRLLVGYSMGAALALHLAAEDPPDALVLLAPFWEINTWLGKLLPVARFLLPTLRPFEKADFSNPTLREQILDFSPEIDLDDPEVQEMLRHGFVLKTALLDGIRRLGKRAFGLAEQVTQPTLVLQGVDDTVINYEHTRRLVRRFAGPVSYHEFAGDHQFFKQDGVVTGRWLGTFLETHIPQPTP